jgi:hypothetical protein
MDFQEKYLKYKIKYLELKNLTGGGVKEFTDLFNSYFGNNWILTGSEAIKIYLEHFQRGKLLTFIPGDVDIIVVQTSVITNQRIGDFTRKQSQPEKSMTFQNGLKSFDVTTESTSYYYEINGYRLMDPKVMLINYEDNRRNVTDDYKITALREILKLVEHLEKKRLPENKKRSSIFEEESNTKEISFGLFSLSPTKEKTTNLFDSPSSPGEKSVFNSRLFGSPGEKSVFNSVLFGSPPNK